MELSPLGVQEGLILEERCIDSGEIGGDQNASLGREKRRASEGRRKGDLGNRANFSGGRTREEESGTFEERGCPISQR